MTKKASFVANLIYSCKICNNVVTANIIFVVGKFPHKSIFSKNGNIYNHNNDIYNNNKYKISLL